MIEDLYFCTSIIMVSSGHFEMTTDHPTALVSLREPDERFLNVLQPGTKELSFILKRNKVLLCVHRGSLK